MIKEKTSDTLERINCKTIKYVRKILKNDVEPLCPYTVVTTIYKMQLWWKRLNITFSSVISLV